MKIIINDDINMIIFLNKEYLKIDFNNIDELEDYFKDLFLTLKNIYNIKLNGFYYIEVFVDKNYGVILELEKEELEYIDYYDNQVDMRVTVNDSEFMYLINDYDLNDIMEIYSFQNNLYGKLKKQINRIKMGEILEKGKIIYKDYDKILKYGKRLEV